MCGIVGLWTRDSDGERVQAELEAAVEALAHRGPDDSGTWVGDGGIALGHTRLAILDLSAAGHQPMHSQSGRYVIVFNGEIYNFADIRRRLSTAGYTFKGSGDTEVLLAAYEEWGARAVDEMIGMFAFAIWDTERRRLELFRDRIGVKPLYFGWDGRTLCFASELKSLRAFKHWKPEIDLQSLGEYLQHGYVSGNRTIYKNVYKLLPGHRLVASEHNEPDVKPYWRLLDALGETLPGDDRELEEQLESLLIDSCRYRMVSDVPVGVFLSGGVDSSIVTAILAKHHDQEIRTYTIGFKEDAFDESQWARKIAECCGTVHTEYILDVNEGLEIARDWGALFDEPFADASGIPTLLVSRLARKEVTVALSADGGDELFSGYQVYSSVLQRHEQLEAMPAWLGQIVGSALSAIEPRLPNPAKRRIPVPNAWRGRRLRQLERFNAMLGQPTPGGLKEVYTQYWQPDEINLLLGDYASPRLTADSYPGTPAVKLGLLDFFNYLPEDVLVKVDRTTMAVSLEGREPLLDHRLVEFAFNLPEHLRRGSLGPKHLLKKILYRYIPSDLVDRPKQGFAVPLDSWLRSDLKELLHTFLDHDRIRGAGLFDPHQVSEAVRSFYKGDSTLGAPLWSLLAFEMWRERWG